MDKRKMSHELQWYHVLNQRTSTREGKFRYENLYHGYLGESYLDQLVEIFGENLDYLDDLTLAFQEATIQIDKILVANDTLWLLDMKYYQGHYIFQNNNWYKNGKILLTNILEQLRKAQRVAQNILNKHQIPLKVVGVLAFMNPKANIEIIDQVPEKILFYQEIASWLYELNSGPILNTSDQWKSALLRYAVPSFKTQKSLPMENLKNLRKGICCRSCHGFQITEKRHFVVCSYGHWEPKETAYTRTVCDFGVLFHDQELKKKQLKEFFGASVNLHYLTFILDKHFPVAKNTGHTSTRKNKGILFEYWFENEMDYFNSLENRKNWHRT